MQRKINNNKLNLLQFIQTLFVYCTTVRNETNKHLKQNNMNYSTETLNILKQYATEDANMIKTNGFGAVTGTKKGCLHMSFENGLYTANGSKFGECFQTPDIECLIEYIMDQYIVETEA